MNKALAQNINTKELLKVLKNFSDTTNIDIEVFEFDDGSPAKIIIRASKNEEGRSESKEDKEDVIQNPEISEEISYKDLLDTLN